MSVYDKNLFTIYKTHDILIITDSTALVNPAPAILSKTTILRQLPERYADPRVFASGPNRSAAQDDITPGLRSGGDVVFHS